MKPDEFIAAILPAAKKSELISLIPAAFTVAEAALESGWGTSGLSVSAKNLFGVKADSSWHGDIVTLPTREFINKQWLSVDAKWRKYATWQACIDDHAMFLVVNKRYQSAFTVRNDVVAFTRAIANAGYATDPKYAEKILSVIKCHNL